MPPRRAEARIALEHLDNLLAAGELPDAHAGGDDCEPGENYITPAGSGRRPVSLSTRRAGSPAFPSFAVEKTRKQHAHLGPGRVDRLPARLLKADLDVKGGSMLDPRTILEILLVELSLPRTD